MERRLCPNCGAYWQCDCRYDELTLPQNEACEHDWAEAVGVDIDPGLDLGGAKVLICRLCGLYAVEQVG